MASKNNYQVAFTLNSQLASNFNRTFNNANKQITNLANTARNVIGIVLGGLGAKAVVGTALTEAMNLEGFRMQLETATKSAEKAGEIMKWSVDLANSTPFETSSVVEASARLEAMSMSAQKYLPQIGDMAGATNKDLMQATEAIIDAQVGELERLKEFGIKKNDIVEYAYQNMGKIQVVNNQGQITNQEKFNEAMFALMEEKFAGGMEKQAGTMKGIMSTITGVTKSAMAEMVGIASDGTIKQGSLMETLKSKASGLASKLTEWQKDGTFSKIGDSITAGIDTAITAFNNLKSWATDTFDNLKNRVLENQPLIDKVKQLVDDVSSAFKDLKGGASTLDWLSDTALPAVTDAIIFVIEKAIDFYNFVSTNWSSLRPVVLGIGTAIATWKVASAIAGFVKVTKVITLAKVAQIKLTAAKIVDKAETLYLKALYAGDFLKSLLMQGKAIAANSLAWVVNTAQLVAQKVGLLALKGVQLASQGVTAALTVAQWALNAAFYASPIGWVVLAIGALIAIGVLLWKNWDTVKAKALELWEGMKGVFGGVGEWFSGLWDGVKSTFKGFLNFIIGGINKIPEGLNSLSFTVPDWVPGIGGNEMSFNLPTIPMFAKGTMSTPKGAFIAGERGPELISGAPGRRVFTNGQTKGMLSKKNTGSPQFIYNPQITVQGGDVSESKLAQILAIERQKWMAEVEKLFGGNRRLAYG